MDCTAMAAGDSQAQCLEFFQIGVDFMFFVKLIIVIGAQVTIGAAVFQDMINRNQHSVRYCHISPFLPPMSTNSLKLREKIGLFVFDC